MSVTKMKQGRHLYVKHIILRVFHSIKRWIYKRIAIGPNVTVERDVVVGPFSIVSASQQLTIGRDTYIGKFCTIQVNGYIGRGVLIGNSVGIVGRRDHSFRPAGTFVRHGVWVGTNETLASDKKNKITINDDVWIGYGCTILSGLEVGRGAIVSAGSVVRDDVGPYQIVSGNPAKVVGVRFNKEDAAVHDKLLSARYNEQEH